MTKPEYVDPLPSPSDAVIAAFLDGEAVDGQALKEALALADGRDLLVDLLALREAVTSMGPIRWSVPGRKPSRKVLAWLAAAASIAVSLTTGYLAGAQSSKAPDMQTSLETVVNAGAPPAPEPTQVIPLRPGVNWTEAPRGH
jgi:hypothetical protein